jgi:hypothetical protein
MNDAVRMPAEDIRSFIAEARTDRHFWAMLKVLEHAAQTEQDPTKVVALLGLMTDRVRQKYGADHNFYLGSLYAELRGQIRVDLGLPV